MNVKLKRIVIFMIIFCAGCAANQSAETATPNFSTAILSPPLSTSTLEMIATATNAPIIPAPIEGTTTTQVNVRAQPAKTSAALGMINIFTKVQIVGKDASGGWYQIRYADALGWVSAEYVQVNDADALRLNATTTPPVFAPPTETLPIAMQDGDSMQAPLGAIVFSQIGAGALQLNGDVSAPNGDSEDWLQFTSSGKFVAITIGCADDGLIIELWKDGTRVEAFSFSCNSEKLITIVPSETYLLRLSAPDVNEYHYIIYAAFIESVK